MTAVSRGWREIILSSLARVSEQAPFYVFTVFVLAYGANTLHQSSRLMLAAVLGAAALSLLTIPLAGHFSDQSAASGRTWPASCWSACSPSRTSGS